MRRFLASSLLRLTVVFAMQLLWLPEAHASYNFFAASKEVPSHDLSPFNKWTSVIARTNQEKQGEDASCSDCPAAKWNAMLSDMKGKSVKAQLDGVNSFFNRIRYVEDKDNWGKSDYWATPFEMLERKAGDCEDYAIAKYIALKELGVPESDMRVMIVEDRNLGRIMHAVLEVRSGGNRYLLDNQASRVADEANVFHYRPIYALNTEQWWAYK